MGKKTFHIEVPPFLPPFPSGKGKGVEKVCQWEGEKKRKRKTKQNNNVPLIKSTTSLWFDWVTHDPLTYSTTKYIGNGEENDYLQDITEK